MLFFGLASVVQMDLTPRQNRDSINQVLVFICKSSIVDRHRFDADPDRFDADPDRFAADPNPTPSF
jgi:hypothetical protein